MKSQSVLAAVLSLFAVACGAPLDGEAGADATGAHEAMLTGSLAGTWCVSGWPGCATISSGGGYLVSGGDVCWRPGDQVYSGLVGGSTPGTYTGTRYQYGSGSCVPIAAQSVTITMNGNDRYTEVTSTGFTSSWYRASP